MSAAVVNVPVIKPLDARHDHRGGVGATAVVTAENHSVIGGLGSAVAEVLAEAGLGRPLRRVGLRDTFAEGARTAASLFRKYGLGTQDIVDAAWNVLRRAGPRRGSGTDRRAGRRLLPRMSTSRTSERRRTASLWAGSGPAGWARSWPGACSTPATS